MIDTVISPSTTLQDISLKIDNLSTSMAINTSLLSQSLNEALIQNFDTLNEKVDTLIKIQELSAVIEDLSGKLLDLQYQIEYQKLGDIHIPEFIDNNIQIYFPSKLKMTQIANSYRIYQNQTLIQLSQKSPQFILKNSILQKFQHYKFYWDQEQEQLKYFNVITNQEATEENLTFINNNDTFIDKIHLKTCQKILLPLKIKFYFSTKLKFLIQSLDIDLVLTRDNSVKNAEEIYISLFNVNLETKILKAGQKIVKLMPIFNPRLSNLRLK